MYLKFVEIRLAARIATIIDTDRKAEAVGAQFRYVTVNIIAADFCC